MKAKVIIENGKTTISLTPDNYFETEVIEQLHKDKSNLSTKVYVDSGYGSYKNHNIEILIEDKHD